MSDALRKHGKIIVCTIVCIGALLIIVTRLNGLTHPSFQEQLDYHCANGHEFTLTVQQLSDHHEANYGKPLRCPECDVDRVARRPAR